MVSFLFCNTSSLVVLGWTKGLFNQVLIYENSDGGSSSK